MAGSRDREKVYERKEKTSETEGGKKTKTKRRKRKFDKES